MRRQTALTTLALVALAAWPLLPHVPYDLLNTAILGCEYLVAALSLVLLTGLVGQISLAQAALVGMGAFTAALATRKLGIVFPASLLVAALFGALTAAVIGVVALRVRGLYLAVATLIFAYLCDQYLFSQPWLVETQTGTSIPAQSVGQPGTIPFFNLADAHVFYYVALAVAVFALYYVANLRDSKLGRAFAALRGSEVAAASLGVNVTRYKLVAFALAGALAGLGGGLTLVAQRTVAPDQFNFVASLYLLSIAVVGGLRSPGGAIASATLFAVLVGEVFFRFPGLANYLDLVSAGLLVTVLLFFRGGLGALPERLRGLLAGRLSLRSASALAELDEVAGEPSALERLWERLLPKAAAGPEPLDLVRLLEQLNGDTEPAEVKELPQRAPTVHPAEFEAVAGVATADGRREPLLLEAEGVTVRFGGLTAVAEASLAVGAGEIVGLIGPNGAGKTTLFNALLGLNDPASGTVRVHGHDVTGWPVHRRAALGVGRTFQVLQLFGDLTVFDNLMVATHLQNRTGLLGALFVTSAARRREATARRRVRAALRLMDLEAFAERPVAGLPFGVLRLVEVARTLVTGARLVCFDEPASGLDSAETERLIEWFRFLRRIGVTLLVIEHDVSMVLRLCDHVYVLDRGELIASGPPAAIQHDERVLASYLGRAAS